MRDLGGVSPQKVRSADNADDIDIKDDNGKITPEISAPEPQENASILKLVRRI